MGSRSNLIPFKWKIKLCLWKYYFDKGYALTSQVKYLFLIFGWATGDIKNTILMIIAYIPLCFVLGFIWVRTDLFKAEQEVGNIHNKFVQEMREKFK